MWWHVLAQLVVAIGLAGVRVTIEVVLGLIRQQRLISPVTFAHVTRVDTSAGDLGRLLSSAYDDSVGGSDGGLVRAGVAGTCRCASGSSSPLGAATA